MDTPTAPAHPRHTQTLELSWDEMGQALTALQGTRVAVRVVQRGEPETLVAVFRGLLGASRTGTRPTLFWPVKAGVEDELGTVEETGIHLHRDRFAASLANPGRTVLHIVQGPVIVNVRGV